MRINLNAVGDNIKIARQRCRLTQEAMAERVGLSVTQYGRIENGRQDISLKKLELIADLLFTPIHTLFVGAFETESPTIDYEKERVAQTILLYVEKNPKAYGDFVLSLCRQLAQYGDTLGER